ncbi:MvdC/MvdD family ATP grasp protein, partial [Tolypothrix bouteillei VB521301_2]|uniref:MvdC/MvdD family ATP grasp protein n=1 Tax=Tolypothrix bouteillei TaxID=1246981 RepID=UPI0038B54296
RGEKFRFDTDRFPIEVQLDIYHGESERGVITDGEHTLDLNEVSSVWYRRMRYGDKLPDTMDKQFREASIKESRVSVRGLIASIKGFHFDKMSNVDLTTSKSCCKVAREVGPLTVP